MFKHFKSVCRVGRSCLQQRNFAFTYPAPKTLREVAKIQLLEREDPETVKKLWLTYHSEKDKTVADVISSAEHNQLMAR